MTPDDILEPLDPEQREVARALTGPVCVLAGAGTGKTRAITHRIAYGVAVNAYQPQSVLAVTFTARAAGEMRTRLRGLGVGGVQARTFHAAALRQLSYFWPEVIGGQMPAIAEHKASLVGEAARGRGMALDRLAIRDVASEIEWAKVSLVASADYPSAAKRASRPAPAGLPYETVADLMAGYEDAKTDRVVVDFEDILLLLADVLARHREVGDTIRRQYRHFVVDEYQDVSPLQQYLLDQWLGGREELCVVGDPSQTIYSFAGASPRHLTDFPRRFPHATVVRLVRDYRSTPQIVRLANDLSGARKGDAVELVAQRPSGPAVGFHAYADDAAEAAAIAERASALAEAGTPLREIAVLYRTNAQSEAFEDALAQRGIGYVVKGGARFFDRDEVKKGILALRAAAVTRPDDIPVAVREALESVGWTEQAPAERGAVRERWDALQALVALADDWQGDLREFVEDLDERAAAQHAPTVDGVTLTTLHAAKGLEWDAVFLAGLSEGLMPVTLAETDAAIDEEKRLLYVGVTRAREHLALSFARSRSAGGRATRKRTRFLTPWWPDEAQRPPAAKRPAVAELGADDLALFETLKEWRREHAEADGKPAFTVLIDATLAEVATKRPRNLGELARVTGIGPSKLDRYGAEVLTIVASHRPA